MDWVLDGAIPWKAQDCLKAATIHIGGTFEEIAGAEDEVWKGLHPDFPFVLLCSPGYSTRRATERQTDGVGLLPCTNGSTFDMSRE